MKENLPQYKTLSIVIPVYNEERTVERLVETVLEVEIPLEKEIVIVEDCSKDNTTSILMALEEKYSNIRVFRNEKNMGKGYSVRRGIDEATGDIILIQDADLEYDPHDYPMLLKPILLGIADVVYGSRFITSELRRILYFWHSVGNKVLTLFSNMISNLNLSDMETCYKVFLAPVIKAIKLDENRFGFEPEVTYKLSRIKNLRIYEVSISYRGRTYSEGKKITWKDGFRAFYVLFKNYIVYKFRRDKHVFKDITKKI